MKTHNKGENKLANNKQTNKHKTEELCANGDNDVL
jgi:hypothetical protein